MKEQKILLSIIVAVHGPATASELFFLKCQENLRYIANKDTEIIFVLDDHRLTIPQITQTLKHDFDNIRILLIQDSCLPAEMFTAGVATAAGTYLMFLGPDLPFSPSEIEILADTSRNSASHNEILAVVDQTKIEDLSLPHAPSPSVIHGWLVNLPVLDISNVCIPATAFHDVDGFDTSPILQTAYGWDLLIRITANNSVKIVNNVRNGHVHDSYFSIKRPIRIGADLVKRYIARAPQLADRETRFILDLPKHEQEFVSRVTGRSISPLRTEASPLRITITGSFWEHHHNWLCFLNYLHHQEGLGLATHKNIFDHLVTRADIEESDIVILSRCKVEQVRDILRWCKELNIPSIYMIDDNWLTVADDWPDPYKPIFSPGTPFYENFLYGVQNSDYVLAYNDLLMEDIKPYAKAVVTLPNSVDLTVFETTKRTQSSRYVIGYSGSPRYSSAPFKALAQVARRNKNVDILLFGIIRPEHEEVLQGCSLRKLPHTSYAKYAQMIRLESPDILLAPMDNSRTSRSKCPNKYLEITAAGAVGIYSRVEPYTWHVKDGVNGVFVTNSDDVTSWIEAISNLLDKQQLQRLHATAREDVARNFSATVVAPQFGKLLADVAKRSA